MIRYSRLYGILKKAADDEAPTPSYDTLNTEQQAISKAESRAALRARLSGIMNGGVSALKTVRDLHGQVMKPLRSPVIHIVANPRLTGVAEDAGKRFGSVLGDMFGKINTDAHQYPDSDIIELINDQETAALLSREAERLRRLTRIQYRKKKQLKEMSDKALRSPFI